MCKMPNNFQDSASSDFLRENPEKIPDSWEKIEKDKKITGIGIFREIRFSIKRRPLIGTFDRDLFIFAKMNCA